jgi:zinc protease
VTLADPRVTQPSIRRYYVVPSDTKARSGESAALEVLAHVLGRGSSSRLYQKLVVEQGVAVDAGASYDSTAVDPTRFSFYVTAKPSATLQQVEQAMDAVITEIIEKGVSEDELERSKARMIADAIYANDNQRSMAQWYGAALATGATVDEVQTWPDRIRVVEAQAVREAARRWLDLRRSVTGYLVRDAHQEEKRS